MIVVQTPDTPLTDSRFHPALGTDPLVHLIFIPMYNYDHILLKTPGFSMECKYSPQELGGTLVGEYVGLRLRPSLAILSESGRHRCPLVDLWGHHVGKAGSLSLENRI